MNTVNKLDINAIRSLLEQSDVPSSMIADRILDLGFGNILKPEAKQFYHLSQSSEPNKVKIAIKNQTRRSALDKIELLEIECV